MRVSLQTFDPRMLDVALDSECDGVRFGSEFCEYLLPAPALLVRACETALDKGKAFTYVTPRASNAGIGRLADDLSILSKHEPVAVTANDYGLLHMLKEYPGLSARLGRLLMRIPARSPWVDYYVKSEDEASDRGRWIRELYSSTSLNFAPTIGMYSDSGCTCAEVDWLPRVAPALGWLASTGLHLAVHLDVVPVTFTRKCHTARFLGEQSPETCSRPCLDGAFYLTNEGFRSIGRDLYLQGNAVLMRTDPKPADIEALGQQEVEEVILHLGAVTGLDTVSKINSRVAEVRQAVSWAGA